MNEEKPAGKYSCTNAAVPHGRTGATVVFLLYSEGNVILTKKFILMK
jgi:hypothetical protein